MVHKKHNYLEYKTWIVEQKTLNDDEWIYYFPDFPEIDSFRADNKERYNYLGKTLTVKIEKGITQRLKAGGELLPHISEKDLLTIYPNIECRFLMPVNMIDIVNRVYFKENKKPSKDQNKNTIEKILPTSFWVGVYDITENNLSLEKKYELYFPELNEDSSVYYTVTVKNGEIIDDIIETKLFKLLSDYTEIDEYPEEWSKQKANEWFMKGETEEEIDHIFGEERLLNVSLTEDHFYAILKKKKDLDLMRNKKSLIARHPTDDHLNHWPPKNKPE